MSRTYRSPYHVCSSAAPTGALAPLSSPSFSAGRMTPWRGLARVPTRVIGIHSKNLPAMLLHCRVPRQGLSCQATRMGSTLCPGNSRQGTWLLGEAGPGSTTAGLDGTRASRRCRPTSSDAAPCSKYPPSSAAPPSRNALVADLLRRSRHLSETILFLQRFLSPCTSHRSFPRSRCIFSGTRSFWCVRSRYGD